METNPINACTYTYTLHMTFYSYQKKITKK